MPAQVVGLVPGLLGGGEEAEAELVPPVGAVLGEQRVEGYWACLIVNCDGHRLDVGEVPQTSPPDWTVQSSVDRPPRVELLDWPYAVEQPVAPAVAAWGAAADLLAADDDLTALVLTRAADVTQETVGAPGAEDPETIVLRQQRGLRRARTADTVEAALVGACDGDLTVGQVLDALATLLDRDAAELRSAYVPVVADLVAEGFLTR